MHMYYYKTLSVHFASQSICCYIQQVSLLYKHSFPNSKIMRLCESVLESERERGSERER